MIPCANALTPYSADDMAAFVVDMLDFDGNACRGRPAKLKGTDDWSCLIDELLEKMKLRTFADHQLLGRGRRGPRAVTAFAKVRTDDVMCELVCAGAAPDGGGGGGADVAAPEGAGPGISAILIETSVPSD
jgi:hypothetical protein